MCWVSYKGSPAKHIASEDITCYKIFCNSNIMWNQNKVRFLGMPVWNKYTIKELHSLYKDYLYVPYNTNPEINIFINFSNYLYRWYIEKGYHSYSTLHKAKLEKSSNIIEVIVKCIIPKGSEYYINETQEIVSSNIIVTDKIVK